MPKKRRKTKELKYGDCIIFGISAAIIAAAALLAIFSVAISKDWIDFEAHGIITIIVNIVSAAVCGFSVARKGEGNIIKCGFLPGIIFGLIITILSLIININAFSARESMRIMLISVAGSTTGSLMNLCISNKRYHK